MWTRAVVAQLGLIAVLGLGAVMPGIAQSAPPPATSAPDQIVRQWFERWNALGSGPDAIDALVAMYEPGALHMTGPSPDQRGMATYRGAEGLRTLFTRIAATQEHLTYRIETETAREETATLFHLTSGPWGGPAAAVQFVAVFTDKVTQKRYSQPGAAFFQFTGSKIHRARFYYADGERVEVEPEPKRKAG